jgi:hypothetical protein
MYILLATLEILFWISFTVLVIALLEYICFRVTLYLEDRYYDALFIRRGRPELAGHWDEEDDN